MIKVMVWNEYVHEQSREDVKALYPDGIHAAVAAGLREDDAFEVHTATLQEPEHGLTEERLAETDVLLWWGHMAHDEVEETIVDRVQQRVLEGMGLIVLHSGHHAKIFRRLMGTNCNLSWREVGEKERVWVCNPSHLIARGLANYFEIPKAEMYGEPFQVPEPDETVFISWFEGGEVFRSGMTWRRGAGKIFYFRPGHESYPIYKQSEVKMVLKNAVRWAAPTGLTWPDEVPNVVDPLEDLNKGRS